MRLAFDSSLFLFFTQFVILASTESNLDKGCVLLASFGISGAFPIDVVLSMSQEADHILFPLNPICLPVIPLKVVLREITLITLMKIGVDLLLVLVLPIDEAVVNIDELEVNVLLNLIDGPSIERVVVHLEE